MLLLLLLLCATLQLLVVLLDAGRPPLPTPLSSAETVESETAADETAELETLQPGEAGYNVYRTLARDGISGVDDYNFVFNGLATLLNNVHESRNTYIAGSAFTVSTSSNSSSSLRVV
jgi:hypothetical protein